MDKYRDFYVVKDPAAPFRAKCKPIGNGPASYLSESGITYSPRHIREWGELTASQKAGIIESDYRLELDDIAVSIAKDKTLSEMRKDWERAALERRDDRLRAIEKQK